MKFKTERIEEQFFQVSTVLKQIVWDIEALAQSFGKEITLTRVWDAVDGESGVHLDKRAVDIRDEHDGRFVFSSEEIATILKMINGKWARSDGFVSVIHHSFNGGMAHLHVQIPVLTKTYENNPWRESKMSEEVKAEVKAYDLKVLGAKLKEQGLDLAEDASILVMNATVDWLIESAQASSNKIDDIVAPLLLAVKPYVQEQLDKIDGEKG